MKTLRRICRSGEEFATAFNLKFDVRSDVTSLTVVAVANVSMGWASVHFLSHTSSVKLPNAYVLGAFCPASVKQRPSRAEET